MHCHVILIYVIYKSTTVLDGICGVCLPMLSDIV